MSGRDHATMTASQIHRTHLQPSVRICASLLAIFFAFEARGQQQPDSPPSKWKFSAWADVFILPDEPDIFNPTFYARTDKLHLEARYNYEDMNTVSLWAGRRFLFGESV